MNKILATAALCALAFLGDAGVRPFREATFARYVRMDQLPRDLREALSHTINVAIAEAGQPWNATDVVQQGLLARRFMIAGVNASHAYVVYEQGGIAYGQHFLGFERDREGVLKLQLNLLLSPSPDRTFTPKLSLASGKYRRADGF